MRGSSRSFMDGLSKSSICRTSIDINGTDVWRTTTLISEPVGVSIVHAELFDVIASAGLTAHSYADDTQV